MNIVIKNVDVVTMDSGAGFLKNVSIGIRNGIIEWVGEISAPMLHGFAADRVVDGRHKLVMPGLINAHTHSAMTIFRNYAGDLTLEEWLFDHIIPAESRLTEEDVYWGTMLGIAEMIKSGTTTFADMYLHMDQVARAVAETGIRANISKGPITSDVRGKSGLTVDVEGCSNFFKEWNGKANGRIKVCVEIHSAYLFDEQSIKGAAQLAKELNTGIHIHILETAMERETCLSKYGMNSPEFCLKCGVFDVPVFAAHCVHLTDHELDLFKEMKVNVVHNPTSNLKLGSGIAGIPAMLERGINVCLGTDGAASNNNLNLFEELHLSAILHKGANRNPVLVNAEQALRMATINGAAAIGFGDEIGCIKPGMKADLLLIDTDQPHFYPLNDPLSAIVYTAQGADVDTVIVDGNILMENRELKTIDLEKVKYRVKEISERVLRP